MASAATAAAPLSCCGAAPSAPTATVLGCGVIGLTTARMLQKHGFRVTILSLSTPLTSHCDPHYTSAQAGAHWFSFAKHQEKRKQAMDELAYLALSGLAVTEPDCGVSVVRAHALFESEPADGGAIPWWAHIVPRFAEWTPAQLQAKSAENGVEYVRAFSYDGLMISVPHYLLWLYREFVSAGGEVRTQRLTHISEAWAGSSASSPPDVVVNCLGLGSRTLGGVEDETMFADRGQTIRIHCPSITDIWRSPGHDATYLLPRGDGTVVLGGTHVKDGGLLHDAAAATAILARCARLVPLLRDPSNFRVLSHGVGLRPGRECGQQRVEVDQRWSDSADAKQRRLVLHAYGHCGDGFQTSWGTAVVLLKLIQEARPQLFRAKPTFHAQHSQIKTGVLRQACSSAESDAPKQLQLPRSKL